MSPRILRLNTAWKRGGCWGCGPAPPPPGRPHCGPNIIVFRGTRVYHPSFMLPKRPLPAKQPKCHSPVSQTDNFLAQTIGRKCVGRDVGSVLQEQIQLRSCGHPAMLALSPPHHYRTALTLLLLIRCVRALRACSVKMTVIE